MISIKPFITIFQVPLTNEYGFGNCTVIPSSSSYQTTYESLHCPRNSNLPLVSDGDTIIIDDVMCTVTLPNVLSGKITITPVSDDAITMHNNANNRLLDSYRTGVFNKNIVYRKFVNSMGLTEQFKLFMKQRDVDLTIISSQTLILIGVLFYEFAGDRDLAHQVCLDPFHQKYDVAVIVK